MLSKWSKFKQSLCWAAKQIYENSIQIKFGVIDWLIDLFIDLLIDFL